MKMQVVKQEGLFRIESHGTWANLYKNDKVLGSITIGTVMYGQPGSNYKDSNLRREIRITKSQNPNDLFSKEDLIESLPDTVENFDKAIDILWQIKN